ncbi:MAG: tetraacyldisaccharide 4'-kinase, partial [Desulfovibrionaceae bacterium]
PGTPWRHSGDEPLLLARLHPGARVVVDPKRLRSGPVGMELYRPDLVVLDDGCQHLAVDRDLDLILLRPDDLGCGWNRVFPAGRWREGKTALGRADAFLVKVPPEGPDETLCQSAKGRLKGFGKPVFPFSLRATGLIRADGKGESRDLAGRPYLLATAVAEPAQVAATAEDLLGYPPAGRLDFSDHHGFTAADVRCIRERAEAAGASQVVATSKDAAKLEAAGAGAVWSLNLDVLFHEPILGREAFREWWEARWAELNDKAAR